MTKLFVFLVLATLSGLVTHVQSAAVASVSMVLAAADRKAAQITTATATISFTTSTSLAVADSITITLPASYFTAMASQPTGVLVPAVVNPVSTAAIAVGACTLTAATLTIVCTISTGALAAGAHKITFAGGQLTTGAATPGATSGLTVVTTTDTGNIVAATVLSLGSVSDVLITIETLDKNQLQATTATVTVAFTTYTTLPFAGNAGKITITLPASYFSAKAAPAGVLVPAAAGATLTSTCALTTATLTIICEIATANLLAGAHSITFASGELTTGAAVAVATSGLTVKTATDAVSAGGSAPALVKAVTAVSITLAAGDRKAAQVTAGVTTFSFTTAATVASTETIVITLPVSYFTAMASQPTGVLVPAAAGATISGCVLAASTLTITCTIATAGLLAGAHKITFAAGQLTTGAATAGSATGLKVSTTTDAASLTALAPSLGTVSDVSITMAVVDRNQLQATTATVTVAFTTTTLLTFAGSAGKITITLPASYFSAKAAPAGVLVPAAGGTATLTSTCTLAAGLTIICEIATADLAAGAHKITFAAGELTTGAAVAVATSGLTVKTATEAVSAGVTAPALVKAVTGVWMDLSIIDRNSMTLTSNTTIVYFTTASILPFASNAGKITITLPANYFSAKATPAGVLTPVSGTATLTSTCNMTAATLTIVCETATADLPVGAHKITFAAGQLTTGAAVAVSASGLMVSTAVDGVSLGASVPALAVKAPEDAKKSASSLLSAAFWSFVLSFLLNF